MGSSARKKKEKKKDFQKPKLKVGKARPKANNFTDTSFKSKAITVNQQSLASSSTHDAAELFKHHLSLASAKSESQRRDALAYLTSRLTNRPPNNPVGTPNLLTKLLPLTSDGHAPVRSQLAKLLKALPPAEITPHVEKISMYIRAGLTHLATDIRDDSLNLLEWILDIAPLALVSCPGGWLKLLATFGVLLGWKPEDCATSTTTALPGAKGWTAASTAALGATKGGALRAHQLQLLAKFLEAGLRPEPPVPPTPRGYWDNLYRLPRQPNPFTYLNLFGTPRDEDSEMYTDRQARQRVFVAKWYTAVMRGMEGAKKEGGAVGRAASELDRALLDGMDDFEDLQRHV